MIRLLQHLVAHTGWRGVARVISVAVCCMVPALWAPLAADELMQARKLAPAQWGAPFPLGGSGIGGTFEFVSPLSGGVGPAVQEGFLGWWTLPGFKLAFWRPLSALTHLADFSLWPDHVWLMHVHSLVWQVLLFGLLARLLHRFLGPREAILALALYCWDDARGFTLGFIANRNALLAGTFGLITLLSHVRWRQTGQVRFALGSVLALAAGLLSAELAVSVTAWLFAYAWCLDPGPRSRRLLSLLPAATVVIAWKGVYMALGYGVVGSGVYVHPLSTPGLFAMRLAERAPWYALGQLFVLPSDLSLLLPTAVSHGLAVLGVVVFAGCAALFADLWRQRPEARFFAVGAVLSVVPVCGSFTSDRNLTFVSMGAAALWAMWLVARLDRPPTGLRRLLLGGVVLVHLVLAAVLLPVRCLTTLAVDTLLAGVNPPEESVPDLEDRTTFLAWVSTDAWSGFGRVRAISAGQVVPRRTAALVMSEGPATYHRVDEHTLRIEVAGFAALESQQMARSPDHPFAPGHTVSLPDVQLTVEHVDQDGRPCVILAKFERPVDDPTHLWQTETAGSFPRWTPPALGETTTVGGLPWMQ